MSVDLTALGLDAKTLDAAIRRIRPSTEFYVAGSVLTCTPAESCPTYAQVEAAHADNVTDAPKVQAKRDLAVADASFIRAIEDLIALLVSKGTITEAELPSAVQTKLSQRRAYRATIQT